jgi:hypothetical protein
MAAHTERALGKELFNFKEPRKSSRLNRLNSVYPLPKGPKTRDDEKKYINAIEMVMSQPAVETKI